MKKIKIKLQQCGSDALGFTYRIVQVTNAVEVHVRSKAFLVGEFLEKSQVEDLCLNRRYEVTTNAIED